ncbi:unnamed protein product [Tuber melanosporum]|uniref:(Perigord truffle) hypothetical protein n=1 Tax=Tuber melanosporum (strain Mel28) TaxID=656061 RepID=D5GE34_TUBMM|nr:uncharacterized protein GSTUM_00006354001 [Tuber melanosporum]CAZ82777.1 unnamed protein product [Tuber melanosporum]
MGSHKRNLTAYKYCTVLPVTPLPTATLRYSRRTARGEGFIQDPKSLTLAPESAPRFGSLPINSLLGLVLRFISFFSSFPFDREYDAL